MLLRGIHYFLIRRSETVHRLSIGEMQEDPVGEVAQSLVLFPAEDENLVLQESWESSAVESDSEIFRLWSELFDDVIVQSRHPVEKGAQSDVVVRLYLILNGELFAEAEGALPHLAPIKQVYTV